MHSRHAVTAFTRLNTSCFSTTLRRYASRHVKTSIGEAAASIPSSVPDEAPPSIKKRTKKLKSDAPLDTENSLSSVTELDTPLPKRRGRPPKTANTTTINTTNPDANEADTPPTPKKRIRKPKTPKDQLAIPHGSVHHTTLAEFLTYAATANLSPTSTVYRGTHYEYTVAHALSRLGFALTRVGRTSDLGIDLLGSWTVPSHPIALNVLVQCKAEAPKPSMIRELEGAVVGAPVRYRGQGTMAILAAAKEATKGVRDAVGRSSMPMAFLNVSTEGMLRQFVWNQAAVESGLEGVGVALRYLAAGESEVALTWKGLPLPSVSSK